jgi:hypothetical protein
LVKLDIVFHGASGVLGGRRLDGAALSLKLLIDTDASVSKCRKRVRSLPVDASAWCFPYGAIAKRGLLSMECACTLMQRSEDIGEGAEAVHILTWLSCAIMGLGDPHPMRLVVNIPAFRVDAYVDDSLVRTLPMAVGMRRFRTPRGHFEVTSIEWNPWWIPPDSPWAAKEKKTPPGPANPMGRVKINFQPLYFLHGTPARQSIGSASSHGCIRMLNEDAIALARLVHQFGTPALTPEDLDRLASDTTRTWLVELTSPVPIEIRYDLAEIRDGRVIVYRDVYELAMRPLRADVYARLAEHGIDTTLVDSARVRALVRGVPRAGKSIALDSLVRTGVLP